MLSAFRVKGGYFKGLRCGSPVPPWLHERLQAQAGDAVAVARVPCSSPKDSKAVPGYRTPESQGS
jgi:hypothetical protein